MSLTATKEYKVLLTQRLLTEPEGDPRPCWRAMVLGFPYLSEEAVSREQAIQQLRARIEDLRRNSEIITLTAPVLSLVQPEVDEELAAQGWDDYGMFKDDSAALALFDDIEEERERHVVGGA